MPIAEDQVQPRKAAVTEHGEIGVIGQQLEQRGQLRAAHRVPDLRKGFDQALVARAGLEQHRRAR
jgi:hypothetical protein